MKKKFSMPTVVIVGRMNVGKSTLFNRLSTDVKTLTLDYEGVTRDFIRDQVCWKDRCFDLIDTGGISLRKTNDVILQEVRDQAVRLVKEASVVLFMCDAKVGLLPEDREISRLLHKLGVPVILLVNKVDTKLGQEQEYEFERLGFEAMLPISAQHGRGISDLFDLILERLPEHKDREHEQEEAKCNVVILGKPNVGKSSLLNLLLKKERAIVANIPGTTREPISERVSFHKQAIQLTDTPGVRRKRGVTEDIEQMMVKTSFKSVEEADVVVLMIDASEGEIVDQELKLAFYVFQDKYKGLIILYNKEDLVDSQKKADLEFSLEPYEHLLSKVIQLTISCKSGKNVGRLMKIIDQVCERYRQRMSDDDLTYLFKEALAKKPLYRNGQMLNLIRAKQTRTGPMTIELIVEEPKFWGDSQFAYLEQRLRKHIDLKGVPVRFIAHK